jgi:hypothetical protein
MHLNKLVAVIDRLAGYGTAGKNQPVLIGAELVWLACGAGVPLPPAETVFYSYFPLVKKPA